MNKLTAWASLFLSSGTLVCCALPSLLVVLGLGSVMGSLVSAFPQLVFISIYKVPIFILSAAMLIFSGLVHFMNRNKSCPVDPKLAKACQSGRSISFIIYLVSLFLWFVGAFFAFILPLLEV